MLKDKQLIRQVIQEQRNKISEKCIKFYRVIKSRIREENRKVFTDDESLSNLPQQVAYIAQDAFNMIDRKQEREIQLKKLPLLVKLCGRNLELDELIYVASKSSQNAHTIKYDAYVKILVQLAKEVTLNPFETTQGKLYVMGTRQDGRMIIAEMEQFLKQHKVFSSHDIKDFINELRYLPKQEGQMEIFVLASFTRDFIEGFPR